MEMIIFLVALFLVLDVAALTGWAPDTRDGRDWQVPTDASRSGQPARPGLLRIR